MQITVSIEGKGDYLYKFDTPKLLKDILSDIGYELSLSCGQGRCLGCGVRFSFGASDITPADEKAFDNRELIEGMRLACKAVVKRSAAVYIPAKLIIEKESIVQKCIEATADCCICVDLGTTTIVMSLVRISNGNVIATYTCANSQKKYGADVISRIDNAIKGEYDGLSEVIKNDVLKGLVELSKIKIPKFVIMAGNTTMMHFFGDYPVDGLAKAPFIPANLDKQSYYIAKLRVDTMPCISAFVGGDIVSGIYALDMILQPEASLLVDLGTNGEIALWDGEKILCTSTAAGPALEGATLSCGVAAIKGAINHIRIVDDKPQISVIDGGKPIGLCGSAVIDIVYELYKNKIIDNGGLFTEEYSEYGYEIADNIYITPEDVQKVLLAKSAIYAGIQSVIINSRINIADIKHVYLAGALGYHTDIDTAVGIGLLPMELAGCTVASGNTSLAGCIRYAMNADNADVELQGIRELTAVLELADSSEFQELFLSNLRFPDIT